MQKYQLSALATFGPGDVLELTDAQIEPRRHALRIVNQGQGGAEVKLTAATDLKKGEVIGLPDLPKRLIAIAEPVPAKAELQKAPPEARPTLSLPKR